MNHDREASFVGEREEVVETPVVERESFPQRVELDAGRAGVEAPDRLAERIVGRVDPGQGGPGR
jgi:hypothetical protein